MIFILCDSLFCPQYKKGKTALVDFKSMMSNRNKANIGQLQESLQKLNKGAGFEKDQRFWRLTTDKEYNGSAIIRFLPRGGANPEDPDVVKTFEYAFQTPISWYIEESPETVGLPDPVKDYNSKLYATGIESDKKKVKHRKKYYISNILVIKDAASPENNGKVFFFKYGQKIFDKIDSKIKGDKDLDVVGVDIFHMKEGANFRLRCKKVENYPNYDSSDFDSPSSLGDEDTLEEIWGHTKNLLEFVDPSRFKSYDELNARFEIVMGLRAAPKKTPVYSKTDEATEDTALPSKHKTKEAKESPEIHDELDEFQKLLHE